MNSQNPRLEVKPNVKAAIVPIMLQSLFISIIFGFIISNLINTFGIISSNLSSRGTRITSFSQFFPSITTIIVISVILLIIISFFRIMNLRARKYQFYDKEAVLYEGFLSTVQKTVPYEKITDFIVYKSVWDRMAGTGSIRLVTAGLGYSAHGRGGLGGGIAMHYVDNPDENYNKLKSIIKKK